MSEVKPQPLITAPKPRLCPVCGKASYSAKGIHPQCAITQADQPRADQLAAERRAEAAAAQENREAESNQAE